MANTWSSILDRSMISVEVRGVVLMTVNYFRFWEQATGPQCHLPGSVWFFLLITHSFSSACRCWDLIRCLILVY